METFGDGTVAADVDADVDADAITTVVAAADVILSQTATSRQISRTAFRQVLTPVCSPTIQILQTSQFQ